MKRVERLTKIEKKRLFSQKQAEELSGFTRSQLLTWEEAGIVVPDREYAILYTWNQIILLRILYYLRQRWTFQQVIKGFENSKESINEIIQKLPKSVSVHFGEFGVYPDTKMRIIVDDLCNVESDIQEKRVRNIFAHEDFPFIEDRGRGTFMSVPKIINELKALAQEKEIKNFEFKVG